MSFRRISTREQHWKQWLADHLSVLVAAGVPDWVLTEENRYYRFLEHGYDHETGWSPSMLSEDQARGLQEFIRREHGDHRYQTLLRDIEIHLAEIGDRPQD